MPEVETHFKQPRVKAAKGRARKTEPLAVQCEMPTCVAPATERHHKLRRSQGGTDDPSNTMDLCSKHHEAIHAHPEVSYGRGYLIRSTYQGVPRSFSVLVPGKPVSLNAERSAHWRVRHEQTLLWRTDAMHLAMMQRPLTKFLRPVMVTVQHYQSKGTMADTGNVLPSAKAIIDGLVDAGVLANDTGSEIAGILFLAPQRGPDGLEVRLDEIAEQAA